jgi:SAM-dependent methyltransferase
MQESASMHARPSEPLYAPTFSERSRQDFVLALKFLANGPMQERVRAIPSTSGLERTLAFREWAAVTHRSQTMMWEAIEPTARRGAERAAGELAALENDPRRHGSLELDPDLPVPEPVASVEIHRQPGGYVAESGAYDPIAGMRYIGSSLIYSAGKGLDGAATDKRGQFLVDLVRARFPGLKPRRILELGCGIGVTTQPIAAAFADAEYHALDVAPGLLRFAHLLAERRGIAVHFHQRDAAATRFPAAHFDLVLSNILFHETSAEKLPQILRECRRLLVPGGAMLHVDVATRRDELPHADRLMNDWQVRWNGEPFWRGFAAVDIRASLVAAGFPQDSTFADFVGKPFGPGGWHVFGARG